MRRNSTNIAIILISIIILILQAAAVVPAPTFRLVTGLPAEMTLGQTYPVEVEVIAPEPFISALAMPDLEFPGKGVVAHGVNREGRANTAILNVLFTAKSSTGNLPGGVDAVAVVVGVRYPNGLLYTQRFEFTVRVP